MSFDRVKRDNPASQLFQMLGGGLTLKIGAFVLAGVVAFMLTGVNDANQRTVVQYPNGTLSVKFHAGVYLKAFGRTTAYNNVLTFDFDREENEVASTIDQTGISVLYQDGGSGTVYGKVRFKLPDDEESMIRVHKDFRSPAGLAHKLLKGLTEEVMNNTASLVSSEDSYAVERGTFSKRAKAQLVHGIYKTHTEQITTTEDESKQFCVDVKSTELSDEQRSECRQVRRIKKSIPVVSTNNKNQPLTYESDLSQYNISISGFQMLKPDYEPSTMAQISEKRKQTMLIITSKANAERAKQDALTSKSQGEANVVKARYAEEVIKEKAVVVAQRESQVALINAKRKVDVAEQAKNEAEQRALQALEYKKEQISIGEGEAERDRLKIEADGALKQKLQAYRDVNAMYAEAMGKHRLVPDINIGGGKDGAGADKVANLIDMMMIKNAKAISLDMSLPTTSK